MNWTCLCAPLSFNNNKPILFNINWNFLFISLRALFSALCPKLLVRGSIDRMLTFSCAHIFIIDHDHLESFIDVT